MSTGLLFNKIPSAQSGKLPTRRLKIAFIQQPWNVIVPPVDGGDSVAILADEIARRLTGSCDVIHYCRLGKHQPRVEHFQSVEYRRASISIDRWVKLFAQQLDRRGLRDPLRPFFSSSLCYRQFINQVMDDLANQNCDIIHIHNFSQFVPLIRARFPNIKIVLQMHCEWLNQLEPAMIEQRIKQADLVLGVSDFLAEKTRQRFPHLASRCRHVYNGAHLARFARPNIPDTNDKRIVYVSRQSPEKGVHTLIDAFKIVLAKHPDARLELIGPADIPPYEMVIPFCDDPKLRAIESFFRPGIYAKFLREKLAQFPAGRVLFFDRTMSQMDLVPHYHAATVFAFPSIWEEPFGMPIVEAMAARLPVVATRGGAFPELIEENKTGLLAERGDPNSLADAILQLFADPARRRAMGNAGFERANSMFGWDTIAQSLLEEYERLMSHTGAGSFHSA